MQVANNVTFKSAYPVAHWVAETNGSFAPVSIPQNKLFVLILVLLMRITETHLMFVLFITV